jgi:hypothetical protein
MPQLSAGEASKARLIRPRSLARSDPDSESRVGIADRRGSSLRRGPRVEARRDALGDDVAASITEPLRRACRALFDHVPILARRGRARRGWSRDADADAMSFCDDRQSPPPILLLASPEQRSVVSSRGARRSPRRIRDSASSLRNSARSSARDAPVHLFPPGSQCSEHWGKIPRRASLLGSALG